MTALPDMPTTAEAGLPDYEALGLVRVARPEGTPKPILARRNRQLKGCARLILRRASAHEQARERWGFHSMFQAKKFHADEIKKYRDIITKAGIPQIEFFSCRTPG